MSEPGRVEAKEKDLGAWRAVEVGRVDGQRILIGHFLDVDGTSVIRLPLTITDEGLPECVKELGYRGMEVGALDEEERRALGEALKVLPYPLAVHAVCNMRIRDFSGFEDEMPEVVVVEGPPQSGKTVLAITEQLTTPPNEMSFLGFDPFAHETLEETVDKLGPLPREIIMLDLAKQVLTIYSQRRNEGQKVREVVSLGEDLSILTRRCALGLSKAYLLDIPGRDFRTKDYGFSVYHLLPEMFPGVHLLGMMASEPGVFGDLLNKVRREGVNDAGWKEAIRLGDWRVLREMVDMTRVPLDPEGSGIDDRGTAYIFGLRQLWGSAIKEARGEFWENQERWRRGVNGGALPGGE